MNLLLKHEDKKKLARQFVESPMWTMWLEPVLRAWASDDPVDVTGINEYRVYRRHFAEMLIKEVEGYAGGQGD